LNPDQQFQQAEVLREEAELEVKSLEKMSQHDGNLWVKPPGDPGALRDQDRSLVLSREYH
tara:strand:- start:673 stop:852 length:180 start_codon:yes stop_codon:yes gene_type:complete